MSGRIARIDCFVPTIFPYGNACLHSSFSSHPKHTSHPFPLDQTGSAQEFFIIFNESDQYFLIIANLELQQDLGNKIYVDASFKYRNQVVITRDTS